MYFQHNDVLQFFRSVFSRGIPRLPPNHTAYGAVRVAVSAVQTFRVCEIRVATIAHSNRTTVLCIIHRPAEKRVIRTTRETHVVLLGLHVRVSSDVRQS